MALCHAFWEREMIGAVDIDVLVTHGRQGAGGENRERQPVVAHSWPVLASTKVWLLRQTPNCRSSFG